MTFFDELAANASARNVSIILYEGNDDAIIARRSTEGQNSIVLRGRK
jgi:carboxypeptidase D